MSDEAFDELPFTSAEDDWPPAVVVEREPRRCKHPRDRRIAVHRVLDDPRDLFHVVQEHDYDATGRCEPATWCGSCSKLIGSAVSRRGKLNRSRGNSIEREVAHRLGLRRVGQFGGLADAEAEWLVVQVKSGGAYPERIDKLLRSLTANANQLRAVVHADAPGPGHRRRALVTVDLDDFLAWFGKGG